MGVEWGLWWGGVECVFVCGGGGGVWSAVQWVRERWGMGLKNDISACANIFFLVMPRKKYIFSAFHTFTHNLGVWNFFRLFPSCNFCFIYPSTHPTSAPYTHTRTHTHTHTHTHTQTHTYTHTHKRRFNVGFLTDFKNIWQRSD